MPGVGVARSALPEGKSNQEHHVMAKFTLEFTDKDRRLGGASREEETAVSRAVTPTIGDRVDNSGPEEPSGLGKTELLLRGLKSVSRVVCTS